MAAFPKSPRETTKGMMYFARMLDKIRLQERGELGEDYQANLGKAKAADGACCNYLRVSYEDLKARVGEGGGDEEILEWCFNNGRRLNEGDIRIWNAFTSKLGWNDFASQRLEQLKRESGRADRNDIVTIGQMIDIDEGRGD